MESGPPCRYELKMHGGAGLTPGTPLKMDAPLTQASREHGRSHSPLLLPSRVTIPSTVLHPPGYSNRQPLGDCWCWCW